MLFSTGADASLGESGGEGPMQRRSTSQSLHGAPIEQVNSFKDFTPSAPG